MRGNVYICRPDRNYQMIPEGIIARKIFITGRVQGVGFRPFLFRMATEMGLQGWVMNTNEGVTLLIQGRSDLIHEFPRKIRSGAPSASRIISFRITAVRPTGLDDFQIRESRNISENITEISPDIAVCDACLDDLSHQPHRIAYPLINCTHCGPRYSIIRDLPYDRPNTTMDVFPMCELCEREYRDITDRRFHAQPVACNHCGPVYEFYEKGKLISTSMEEILARSGSVVMSGGILAIKGVGGFHLACDAFNSQAVADLRRKKRRETKPLAILFRDAEILSSFVRISAAEKRSLTSWQRPVVLLQMRPEPPGRLAPALNEGLSTLGVMLPYMPFQVMLMRRLGTPAIVLTSGNFSEDPVVINNAQAMEVFSPVTDYLVTHERIIYNRVDDSVVRVIAGRERVIRRARGFCPDPIWLKDDVNGILAMGAELVNCFCIGKGQRAYLSPHIGDLKNPATQQCYRETIDRLVPLFRAGISGIVTDLHPEYFSSKHAESIREGLEKTGKKIFHLGVQHHHAHVASCMAEHHLNEPVIGVAFDGTGFGTDGNIWGSEFFVATFSEFSRLSHFMYLPMPGGDKAVDEPWRMALSCLYDKYGDLLTDLDIPLLRDIGQEQVEWILRMIRQQVNCPLTCGAGRYFDAAAALLGLCRTSDYEGEAPMRLESLTRKGIPESYPVQTGPVISFREVFSGMVEDLRSGIDPEVIATKFHNSVISAIFDTAIALRRDTGISRIVLSGGVFQNRYLLEHLLKKLKENKFNAYTHSAVPTNDGGIALGQLVIAANKRRKEATCV